MGYLVRQPKPLHRVKGLERRAHGWVVKKARVLEHRRFYETGAHRVDSYLVRRVLESCGLRQSEHPVFRSNVSRRFGEADRSQNRRVVDDRPAVALREQ